MMIMIMIMIVVIKALNLMVVKAKMYLFPVVVQFTGSPLPGSYPFY